MLLTLSQGIPCGRVYNYFFIISGQSLFQFSHNFLLENIAKDSLLSLVGLTSGLIFSFLYDWCQAITSLLKCLFQDSQILWVNTLFYQVGLQTNLSNMSLIGSSLESQKILGNLMGFMHRHRAFKDQKTSSFQNDGSKRHSSSYSFSCLLRLI